jgi:hypothetical protein
VKKKLARMALKIISIRKGQKRQPTTEALMKEMRNMQECLQTIETTQRRGVEAGDMSDEEEPSEDMAVKEEHESVEERIIKEIMKVSSKPQLEVPMYEGSLNVEELIDWIATMDKYFEYEEVEDNKKVKFVVTRLKGHVSLWWDSVQDDRRKRGKKNITSWDRMVTKLKSKFMPRDYYTQLFRRLQNLRQKEMNVKAYTEEFYKLTIRERSHRRRYGKGSKVFKWFKVQHPG